MYNKITAVLALGLLLGGCKLDLSSDGNKEDPAFSFDFEQNDHGWSAGFSDYPPDDPDTHELSSGLKALPTDSQKQGFMLSGHNRSDDLFMYIKGKFTGLEPSSRYQASISVNLLTNAGEGCMGIGGAPGESVWMKFGFGEQEPKQADYYLNLDKGAQNNNGKNAKIIGDIAASGANCEGSKYVEKVLASNNDSRIEFTTNQDGSIWLFVGTDSGYEGKTTLYYDKIDIQLKRL
ncbi:hypothetical protein [Bowmanella denitrificans]|uniref:hypothetical protein n=1 Tax=Bowmanella denitrificans TaxID=366582 RepID=UPI000C9B1313|nr:hypothetical protein [Bowmanella denitrificans]